MAKILAADIGGTNSRFALFESHDAGLAMVDSIWLETHGAATFPQLLEQLWESDFSAHPGGFDAAVLAPAGAVIGGKVCPYLPNAPWGIDIREVNFGTKAVCLINDFSAQAFACRTSAVENALVIQEGEGVDGETIGVIGAGTGLGYSALLKVGDNWTALPSEGGHMAFPFIGRDEAEYAEFNRIESGRNWPEGDSVVTGLGLHLVHKFLTGEDLTPREISARITPESETTKWYARFYGRACRNWALGLMSLGGFFIAGGVASKNPMFVNVPEFMNEFHNSHVYADFLHSVPVKLNGNEESGLFGAAFYGAQLLNNLGGDE
ncbi:MULTISPECIES: glucokinase [unclassified Pseudodesulfovibrio]|uniref:glucokinase n=1 Tax=unclassified Pseudodesulfovibrio TaxID=2661612 RepID=UPI000FEC084A|nr:MULTISPECIES: glucokinase [unclassified Pseudodesulfovibrio]MCJ2163962.1 glucokinase [Pseudodesulfovibrio sp. S3-i]RWU05793.1 glucokinase [Pseudodesulfovibrio sp. S3]